MILADYHVHTEFSSDCKATPEEMIKKGIELGLKTICITDHIDYDFPEKYHLPFVFDVKEYFQTLTDLKNKYEGEIDVQIGIELGLKPYLQERYEELVNRFPFDFVIGSTHLVDDIDPYYKDEFWDKLSEKTALTKYFETTLENIRAVTCFDSLGHLDYIIRYDPENKSYDLKNYSEPIDEILKTIINQNKALEINSSGFKAGLNSTNPCLPVIRRYIELGGEMITIGSDAHLKEYLGFHFNTVLEMLKKEGLRYYTIYQNRKPSFIKL